jgi:hypothetical protein
MTERQERLVKNIGTIAAKEFEDWFSGAYPFASAKMPDKWGERLGEFISSTFKEEIQWRGPYAFTSEWNRAADLAHILLKETMSPEEYASTAAELARIVLSASENRTEG